MTPYVPDETHDAPAAGEDRLTFTPRADGGYDLDADFEAPRNVPVATVEVGAVTIEGGRIRVHLRVRPAGTATGRI